MTAQSTTTTPQREIIRLGLQNHIQSWKVALWPRCYSRNPVSLVAFIREHCMQACTIATLNNLPKCSLTIDDIISAG